MLRPGRIKIAAIVVLVVFALGWLAIASGLRWNGSVSFPVGLYAETHKRAKRGDLVIVTIPEKAAFTQARERGYLNVGYSPVSRLLKRLVGVAGDRVTIDSTGVQVNGILLDNSTPLPCDGQRRPLAAWIAKDRTLCPGEVLLMSEYSPISFDSRYFGPLKDPLMESVVPLLTWK